MVGRGPEDIFLGKSEERFGVVKKAFQRPPISPLIILMTAHSAATIFHDPLSSYAQTYYHVPEQLLVTAKLNPCDVTCILYVTVEYCRQCT